MIGRRVRGGLVAAMAVASALGLAGAAVGVGAAVGAGVAAASPAPRTSLAEVSRDVMCPVCGESLDVANSPQAERERAYIRQLIAQGETKQQIERALVGQFGPGALALPSRHGFDLVVYIVPAAVVAALVGIVALLLPRWRRRSRTAGPSPAPALTASESARLEEELARYDR